MKSITKKSEIELTITRSREIYFKQGISRCVDQINQELLSCKIRFPLLEYSADLIIEFIAESEIVAFCQEIMLKNPRTKSFTFIVEKLKDDRIESIILKIK